MAVVGMRHPVLAVIVPDLKNTEKRISMRPVIEQAQLTPNKWLDRSLEEPK
jgi:hypothetical protein